MSVICVFANFFSGGMSCSKTFFSSSAFHVYASPLPFRPSYYIGLEPCEGLKPFMEQCCQPNLMKPSPYSSGGSWWWSSGASGGNVGCTVVCWVLDCWTGVVLIYIYMKSAGVSCKMVICKQGDVPV